MNRIIILIFIVCFQIRAFSQKEKGDIYIAKYKEIAMAEMQRSGVPAAIILAQGILESSYGESNLCVQSNNHFGIKCKTEWTGKKVFHDDDSKQECFRSYLTAEASFIDHSNFLKDRPYYTALFKLAVTDFEGWAYGLKQAGYATEKNYPQKLLKVINDYNLNQYTLLALQNAHSSVTSKNNLETKSYATVEEKEEVEIITNPIDYTINNKELKSTLYPTGVFTINHSKVILAKKGTSLLAVANQYNITLNKLLAFNDMDEINILVADTLIFLEKKLKKGAVDFHVMQADETLHAICQKEGVRLDAVKLYNHIKQNKQPISGEKIYLRELAPVILKSIVTTHLNTQNYSE